MSASRNSLQSYELLRLNHAANLRKEIGQLLDSWLEENASAMLARWLMEQRERPLRTSDAPQPAESRPANPANSAHSVSDNLLAHQAACGTASNLACASPSPPSYVLALVYALRDTKFAGACREVN